MGLGATKASLRRLGRKGSRWLTTGLAAVVITIAVALLYRTLSGYSRDEIIDSLSIIPSSRIGLAGLFAAASYLCLTCFDWLALRYVGADLPYRRVALTSFCSLS